MSDQPKLGQLLDEKAGRDAVHVAIAPVVAASPLVPGQHVGFHEEGNTELVGPSHHKIGIVDPYLTQAVKKGQRFYLFLYPQTIQSLRHVWTHPSFPPEFQSPTSATPAESEAWLRKFCSEHDCPDYESLMELFDKGDIQLGNEDYYGPSRMDGEYIYVYGQDAHGEIPDEFWVHVENVLGKPMRDKPRHFTCSC